MEVSESVSISFSLLAPLNTLLCVLGFLHTFKVPLSGISSRQRQRSQAQQESALAHQGPMLLVTAGEHDVKLQHTYHQD